MVFLTFSTFLVVGVPRTCVSIKQDSKTSSLPSEIKIGGIFPISKRPEAGRDRRDAFLMAIEEINRNYGEDRILPFGVELIPVVKDDNNTAEGGRKAAQELIEENVTIVIGASGSTVSAAVALELASTQIPQISYASTAPGLSDRGFFPFFMRVVPSDGDQSLALADLAAAFNWRLGAVIHTNDSYGMGLAQSFSRSFGYKNGLVVTDQEFSSGAQSVTEQLNAIKEAAPQFILGHFIDLDARIVLKQAMDLGLNNTPWILTDGSMSTSIFQGDNELQKELENVIGTFPAVSLGEEYQTFNETWLSPYWAHLEGPNATQQTGVPFNSYAPMVYDATYIAAKGLAKADTTDGINVLNALYNVTHEGASGYIEFNEFGEPVGKYDVLQLVNGAFIKIGHWNRELTLNTGVYNLMDGSSWEIFGNKAVCMEQCKNAEVSGLLLLEILFAVGTLAVILAIRKPTKKKRKFENEE